MTHQTHIDTVNGAHAKYNALMFSLRASLPDATERDLYMLEDALENALITSRVREAINHLQQTDIIATVREGVSV